MRSGHVATMMSIALDILLFFVGWAHVLLAPYTKVEESFNLHATHDVLMYGVSPNALRHYDHFTFSGAVARTFIGSVLVSWLSTPVIYLATWLHLISQKGDLQTLVRLVLASINAFGLCLLRRAVSRRFGHLTGLFFALLTATQFHLPFWMGRTLPNMFALLPFNAASWLLLDQPRKATKPSQKSVSIAISLLTFTAVVFRAEVALYLIPLVLQSLLQRHISLINVILVGLASGFASIALTVVVDSYFWDIPLLWPELSGVYFNIFQGKSSDWGTSPWQAYWATHLPKLLLSSLPLSIIGFVLDQRIRTFMLPSLLFIGLISNLAHKEWRFIIYVVPIFNVAAARGAKWLVSHKKTTLLGRLLFLVVPSLLALNIFLTSLLTLASTHNYPGGKALTLFHKLYPQNQTFPQPHIHISNLAAQTGASLFLHTNAPPFPSYFAAPATIHWTYDKTESLSFRNLTQTPSITHLISEVNPAEAEEDARRQWKVLASVKGFERWVVDWSVLMRGGASLKREKVSNLVKLGVEEKLWILERILEK